MQHPHFAVFNMSKIQIWKRITTLKTVWFLLSLLYLICQRYKFESESQPIREQQLQYIAVFNMSKIQIWKRITTGQKHAVLRPELYLICQRYKFESESQPALPLVRSRSLLYLICQRYKFESESQHPYVLYVTYDAVFNMSKIQIWKRITTPGFRSSSKRELYLICQRYKFESESQLSDRF